MSSSWSSTEGCACGRAFEYLQGDFGLKTSRDASGTDTLDITTQLPLGGQSRGVGDWVIRGLKVLGVDIAGTISDFVADKVEGQLAPGPGLYRCSPTRPNDLATPKKLNGKRPTLIFLHGTGSSTEGSFGELWKGPGARIGDIVNLYGDNLLALQHRTLTQSPIENARDLVTALAKVLPPGSELHLVSHSRGGLIGELVARGNRIGGGSFDQTDLRIVKDSGRALDAVALRELRDLLDKQRYVVSRFVRVACPTRGTTLAGNRLDKYLSVILNVLETIPGLRESLVFDTFASLLAAVVKKRADPEDLPGLEAMMPESALMRLLNRPDVRTHANLRILGGDVEGTGFWGRLKAFVTDLYYREDHDLIVNTPAMFGGVERAETVRYWVDTGGRVNHFNYFANADTAARLVKALADEKAPDFHDVTRAARHRHRGRLPEAGARCRAGGVRAARHDGQHARSGWQPRVDRSSRSGAGRHGPAARRSVESARRIARREQLPRSGAAPGGIARSSALSLRLAAAPHRQRGCACARRSMPSSMRSRAPINPSASSRTRWAVWSSARCSPRPKVKRRGSACARTPARAS